MKAIARSLALIGVATAGTLSLGTPQAKAQVSVNIGTGGYGAYPALDPLVASPTYFAPSRPDCVPPYPCPPKRPYYGGPNWGYGGYRDGFGYRGRYDRRDWDRRRGGYGDRWDDHRGRGGRWADHRGGRDRHD
jgi:hypothetical protein